MRKVFLAIFTIKKRVCLKICVSNEITATESLKMLQQSFEEYTLLRTQAFEYHKVFSEGRESIENLLHAVCSSIIAIDDNIENVNGTVLENRRVGIRKIAEALNISYEPSQHILVKILGMKQSM